MPKVLNASKDVNLRNLNSHELYVGRPTFWGNPFYIGRDGTREEVIERYRNLLLCNPLMLERVKELKGKDLVCWCAPKPCHADILLELANE